MSFCWEIFSSIFDSNGKENLVISSLSIQQILSLLVNGAKNETEKELLKMLHQENRILSNQKQSNINQQLVNDDFVEIKISNSIWVKKGCTVNPNFQKTSKESYNAGSFELESAKKVNEWISNSTDGKIKDVVKDVNPSTIMLLINAINFVGKWKKSFDPKNTSKQTFSDFDGKKGECDLMFEQDELFYLDATSFQAVQKDYGENYSAIVILPKKTGKSAMEDLIKQIAKDAENVLSPKNFSKKKVKFYVPRFEFEFEISLKENLKSLGMVQSFSNKAQFGDLCDQDVYVSDVIHKARIKFDEEGTKAQAVTVVKMRKKSKKVVEEIITFRADRPFLVVLKHNKTDTIFFTCLIQKI